MARITEEEAEKAYRAIHSLQHEKAEITKEQKGYKGIVKDYLAEHPEGFYVFLEDARGNTHDYHVFKNVTERVSLDKDGIRAQIMNALKASGEAVHVPKTLTNAYLARMVERGILSADDIEDYEEVNEANSIKKQKVKGGRPEPVQAAPKQQGGQMTLNTSSNTMTVHRGDGSVEIHHPTVMDGEGNVLQEGSVEKLPPKDEEPPRTWRV